MASTVAIEDIEELRRQQGIDDVELRMEIRRLRPGDTVRLTISLGLLASQPALVRITQIRGSAFRGKLIKRLPKMPAGEIVVFTTAHIHSVPRMDEAPA